MFSLRIVKLGLAGAAALGAWTVVAVAAVLWVRRHRAVAG